MSEASQSQAERDLNSRIDGMLEEARQDHKNWNDIYSDARDYLWNNQLVHIKKKAGWPRLSANYLFPAMIQEVSILATRSPRILVRPQSPDDETAVSVWGPALQWQFTTGLNVPELLVRCTLDAKVAGHYAVKVYWEPKAEWNDRERRWAGRVMVSLLRTECVLVDPNAERWQDAEYIGTQRRIPLQDAINRWPDHREEIEQAARDEADAYGTVGEGTLYVSEVLGGGVELDGGAKSGETARPTNGTVEGRLSQLLSKPFSAMSASDTPTSETTESPKPPKYVTVLELWFKDRETETVSEDEDVPLDDLLGDGMVIADTRAGPAGEARVHVLAETSEPLERGRNWPSRTRKFERPKFPHGRRVLRIGPKTFLEKDGVWPHKHWPIVIGVNHRLPHTWHGLNGVEMGRGLQDYINLTLTHLANNAIQTGNPIVKIEEGTLAADPHGRDVPRQLRSSGGSIWWVRKGGLNKIQTVEPAPLSQGHATLYQLLTREIQDQTGIQEIARGRTQTKRQTGYEVARLEENSRLRVALQSLHLDEFTVELMGRVARLMQAHMRPGELVRIVGEDKRADIAQLDQESLDVRFDIDLDVGRALPHDQEREQVKARELFELLGPALTDRLLDAYEVPNKDDILLRIDIGSVIDQLADAVKKNAPPEEIQAILSGFVDGIVAQMNPEGEPQAAPEESEAQI